MIYVAYFFAAVFFVNAIPHFVQGVTGHKFPSPFAKPMGIGLSSPLINVLWGSFNFAVAYALMLYAGCPDVGLNAGTVTLAVGGLLTAMGLAVQFGKVNSARQPGG